MGNWGICFDWHTDQCGKWLGGLINGDLRVFLTNMRVSTNRENKVHPPTWNVGWFGASGSDLDWELLMGVTIKHANNPSGFRSSGGFTKLENNKIFSKFIKLRTIKLLDYWLRLLFDFWITGFRLLFQINPAKNYFTSSDPQHDTLFWRMTLFLTYNLEVYMAYVNIYIYIYIFIYLYTLTFFLACTLTFCLTIFLAYTMTFYLTFFLTLYLVYIYIFWHSVWHSLWHVFRSRRAQLPPKLASWVQAKPTGSKGQGKEWGSEQDLRSCTCVKI